MAVTTHYLYSLSALRDVSIKPCPSNRLSVCLYKNVDLRDLKIYYQQIKFILAIYYMKVELNFLACFNNLKKNICKPDEVEKNM